MYSDKLRALNVATNPTRYAILSYLYDGDRTRFELSDFVGLGDGALHYHLNMLKMCGLIRSRRGVYRITEFGKALYEYIRKFVES